MFIYTQLPSYNVYLYQSKMKPFRCRRCNSIYHYKILNRDHIFRQCEKCKTKTDQNRHYTGF